MSEWRECKLGDITSKIGSGATPTGGENSYKQSGISLIRSQNVYDFNFHSSGLAYIDETQANLLNNVSVEENDILMNITGESVTRCCLVPPEYLPARVNQHVSIIRPKKNYADYKYIFYYLHSIKPELNSIAEIGCTRRALTKEMLENVSIIFPSLPEQRAIAGVLSSLNDKIDLLHRQNKTLEAMAEALWRKMFVEDADPKWKKGKLGDFGEFKNGINYSRNENGDSEYSILNVRDIVESKYINVNNLEKVRIDKRKATPYLLKKGDIVIVRSASPGESLIVLEEVVSLIYSGFSIRLRCYDKVYSAFLFHFLQSYKKEMDIFSDGTTLKNINQEILNSIELINPAKDCVELFNDRVVDIDNKILLNQMQIHILIRLRDALLPKLMSGEVRVKE